MSERKRTFEAGPGFVRAKECPDCGHTRCGEDCVCNCDAARAEHEAAQKDATIKALADQLEWAYRDADSYPDDVHAALRLAGRLP